MVSCWGRPCTGPEDARRRWYHTRVIPGRQPGGSRAAGGGGPRLRVRWRAGQLTAQRVSDIEGRWAMRRRPADGYMAAPQRPLTASSGLRARRQRPEASEGARRARTGCRQRQMSRSMIPITL